MNPASNRAPTKTVEQPITPHSRTAKILHWGFILVFAYGLAKQLDDVEELEDFGLLQNEMIFARSFLSFFSPGSPICAPRDQLRYPAART